MNKCERSTSEIWCWALGSSASTIVLARLSHRQIVPLSQFRCNLFSQMLIAEHTRPNLNGPSMNRVSANQDKTRFDFHALCNHLGEFARRLSLPCHTTSPKRDHSAIYP